MASGDDDGPGRATRTFFVSYVRENEAWAEWIAWQLREAGWQVDVQAWHSVPGTNVVAWLDRCLARADHVLLVLSAAFLRSAGAGAEWQARFDPGERTLIPIRVELCAPPGLLSPLVRIDLFDVDELDARRALLRGLRGALDGHLVPAGQPPFPPGGGLPGEGSDLGEGKDLNEGSQLAQPGQPRAGAEPGTLGEAAGTPGPEFPGLERPESFVGWVRDACADRYPGASVVLQPAVETRVGERAVSLLHLEVTGERDGERGVWPVGLCPGRPDRALVSAFHRLIHARYEARDRYVESDLVYGAGFAEPEVRRWARRQGIRLSSLAEFEGRWDPQGYVLRQTRRLTADPSYPPELYVPQRYVLLDDPPGTRPTDDVFTAMVDWLDVESARMLLVLGEFGHGKSFLLHELARVLPLELPKVVPMLVELRALEKSHHVDHLLALHLAKVGEPDANVSAVRRMLDRGRVVLLFDGFDELAQRVTFDRAAEHLGMILDAVSGRAKIVLTSRTQHFASDDQWRTAFGERVRQLAGSKLIRLADFDESQIREYLVRLSTRAERTGADPGGAWPSDGFDAAERRQRAEWRADARLRLIHDIRDLLGLSANPRMLSFIAELPEGDLLAARSDDGTISSADLYATLIERWLRFEADRRRPTRGSHQSLDRKQLRTAVDALAVALWDSGGEAIALSELTATVGAALTDLSAAYLSAAEAAFAVGSGSLLRRGDDDRFSFAHRSVMEYLVAVAAAAQLAAGGDEAGELLERREMSELMVDFLAGTADFVSLRTWAGAALTRYEEWTEEGAQLGVDRELPVPARALTDLQVARDNALALSRRLGFQLGPLQLAGQDLRRRDLSGQNLRYAGLAGANLAGLRLHDVDLTGADLTDADLRGAWFVRPVLTGAHLAGSHWDQAVLIDPLLDDDARDGAELSGAVLSGRDLLRPVLRPAATPGVGSVFSPDAGLLAVASGSAVLIVAATDLVELDVLQHPAAVRAMAFLAEDRLATVDGDDEVRVWTVESGEVTVRWRVTPGVGRAVAFCADGSRLAAVGVDGFLRIWDVTAARRTAGWPVEPGTGHDLVFSDDAALLASRDAGGCTRVWDAVSGRPVAAWTAHDGTEPHINAFLDGGSRVATAGLDGYLRVWDTATGRFLAEQVVEPAGFAEVAFSADGAFMAAVDTHGLLRVWPVSMAGAVIPRGVPTLAAVATRPAFSPSGALLATVDRDGHLEARDVSSGRLLAVSKDHPAAAAGRSALFASDTRVLVTCAGRAAEGTLAVHQVASGRRISGHGVARALDPDTGLHISADTWLAALSADGSVSALGGLDHHDANQISVVRLLPPNWAARPWARYLPPPTVLTTVRPPGGVTAAALSPDGRVLAVGDDQGHVRFFGVDLPVARAGLRRSAAHATGPRAHLAWAAAPWTEAVLAAYGSQGPSTPIRSLVFSPSGPDVAVVGEAGLSLWRPTQRLPLFERAAAIEPVAVTFSPTGRMVAAGGSGIGVWMSETGFRLVANASPALTNGSVSALAFSPDERLLAVGGQRHGQGRVWLWEVSSGRLAAELVSESGPVVDLVFAPGGRTLAVAGADHTIRYWDVAERALAATAVLFGNGGHAVLLPNGQYLVAGWAQGALWWTAKRRRFGPDELDGLIPAAARLDPDRPIPILADFPALAADPDPEPSVHRPRRRLLGRRHP
ncbi:MULTISPECIES: TIR domain-containing protein [Frankia]|uniref:TIR domain-containing protein n=1 Tax=Frankia TaxID=1854 RepID=UPI00138B1918|nr:MULTISPECIES: TIR domain-containing protein [Frankia]